jgi:hypothetical protein
MPNLTYTVADFSAFTKILSADVNSRFSDIKTLLNTTKLDSTNVQQYGLTRDRLAAGTANQVLINDGSGNISSEATLALSRGGLGGDFSSLSTQAGKGIVVNTAGTALAFGSPIVDKLTQSPAADVTTLTAGGTISLNDAVCLDLDNNGNYRVFRCDASKAYRRNNFWGFAIAAATATPQIQTFVTSADLVSTNVITYKINGRLYSTTYATSNDATMTALAVQMATDPDVQSASVTGSSPYRTITITGTGAIPINFTSVANTGAATITMTTTQSPVGQAVQIRTHGDLAGFATLTTASNYYLSSVTPGAITTLPTDTNPVFVGQALSADVLFVNRNVGSYQFSTSQVLVRALGGSTGSTLTAGQTNSEHFNFTSWSAGTAASTAYTSLPCGEGAVNGLMYTVDGVATSGTLTGFTNSYNKSSWSVLSTRGTAKICSGIAVIGTNLYLAKGQTTTNSTSVSTANDKFNGTAWSSGTAYSTGNTQNTCFYYSNALHICAGVDSTPGAAATHETYDGSSIGSATAIPVTSYACAGAQSAGSKGIALKATGNTYQWNGSWSANIPLGYVPMNGADNIGNAGPASGYSTSNANSYVSGGSTSSSNSITTTGVFNGTSWGTSTASTTARAGAQGACF